MRTEATREGLAPGRAAARGSRAFIAPVARLLLSLDRRFSGLEIMPEAGFENPLPWSEAEVGQLQGGLLHWFRGHARDLPWRRTRDPYAVFVSEFMLQQTQAAAVVPYFERWLVTFPTWEALAEVPVERVLKAWEGLGYYHRARNLHRAAREVCARHGGKLPADYYRVLALPGVGRYTVGAICSIAFGMRLPVLDGNVMRVLSRLADFTEPVDTVPAQRELWRWAEALVPERHPGDFNQAVMELGALVCSRSKPACLLCPVRKLCRATDPAALPVKSRRVVLTPLEENVEIVLSRGRVLMVCDPASPRWPGLWQFPRIEGPGSGEAWRELPFAFTRYRGRLRAFPGKTRRARVHERWFTPEAMATAPMPAPHRKMAAHVEDALRNGRVAPAG